MKRAILSTIIMLSLAVSLFAEFPSHSCRIYWSGMWEEQNNGSFQLGYWYPDSFHVSWSVISSVAEVGYPYHYGNVLGVNDTIKVRVYFDNRKAENFDLSSVSPETWFYPVLYDPYVDVFKSKPVADTSAFKYRFEHWVTMVDNEITTKPDSIYCFSRLSAGAGGNYGMIYSIWGVAPGKLRVILKPTASKPSNVMITLDTPNNKYTMVTGQELADTLNAYSNIAINALLRHEYTLFNNCVSDIFSLNPQSLIGWALRYHGYDAQNDTTNALVALDSVLYNLNNRIDPLIPDSSNISPIEDSWLRQWNADYQHYRGRMLYPKNWRLRSM